MSAVLRSAPPALAVVALAHQRPEGLHRCLRLPLGGSVVHLCARCAGLYPAMALAASARLGGLEPAELAHPALRLGLPLAGAAAWAAEQAGAELGRPARVASGLALGLGVGWAMGLHLAAPWPAELVELGAALGLVLVLGLSARWLRAARPRDRSGPPRERKGELSPPRNPSGPGGG